MFYPLFGFLQHGKCFYAVRMDNLELVFYLSFQCCAFFSEIGVFKKTPYLGHGRSNPLVFFERPQLPGISCSSVLASSWSQRTSKWLLVKHTGYPKNPIGKRKNRPSHLWSPFGGFFLTAKSSSDGKSFHRIKTPSAPSLSL